MNKLVNTQRVRGPYRKSWRLASVTVGLLLLLGACATATPPPTAALQAAESAIAAADQARVANYASQELTEARRNLSAANDAVRAKNMTLALHLAEQSQVGAQLATAKAEVVEAQMVNDEMIKSIETLKTEMQRNSGAK